ncbi:MAG: IS66 family insertion sequence element accessory protein TnpB [Liquorilactobacillus ghanensis]|uniref:IS66 family insertion sequence element accessory protein TnpB n=1 Tax=Liquorilactobacillus ghanensis TaxID=399370 RepID=UPI0039E9F3F8
MMLLDMRKIKGIYLICGKTDLRRGIDGLANIVLDQFKLDPYSKSLYLFLRYKKRSIQSFILGRRWFLAAL